MKLAISALAILLSLGLAGCGANNSVATTSGFKSRVFATNSYSSSLQIVDATDEAVSPITIAVGTTPTIMAVPPGSKPSLTLVLNSATNTVSVVTNSSESVAGNITLLGPAVALLAQNTTTGYAALRDQPCGASAGAIAVMDIASSFTVTQYLCVPFVDRLVLSPDGSILLAFSDPASSSPNSVYPISTASPAANPIPWSVVFDHPVGGVFSSDGSTVYILNCGPECGGSAAGVQAINVSTGTSVGSLSLLASTTALLSGSTLYVAGTCAPGTLVAGMTCPAANPGVADTGVLNVLNVSTTIPTVTTANLTIGDGFHNTMALGSNNKLFIGATGCTNDPASATPSGCVSIYDVSAGGNPVIDTARDPLACDPAPAACTNGKGFVTGMTAINNRSVFYVVEGAILRVFNTTTSTEIPGAIPIVGIVADAKAVDQ